MTPVLRSLLTLANRSFDTASGLCLLLAVFAVANAGQMPGGIEDFFSARLTVKNFLILSLFLAIWNTAFRVNGLHGPASRQKFGQQTSRIIRAATIGTVPLLLFPLTSRSGAFSASLVMMFWVLAIVVEVIGRSLISLTARGLSRSLSGAVKLVIVGSGPRAMRLLQQIETEDLFHYHVLGFFDQPGSHEIAPHIQRRMLGGLEDLERYLARNVVDLVVVTLPMRSCYAAIHDAIGACEHVGVEVQYPSDVFALARAKAMYDPSADIAAVRLTHVVEDYRLLVKRVLDILGATCGLVVLAPLLLVCAAVIRLDSPGPVFFSQWRYGFNRRQFRMYKLRTMVVDAEAQQESLEHRNEVGGPVFKIRQDPRITRVGRFLRKSSLDELPQLFNVLIGDMSLVGPRPISVRDVTRFTETSLMRRFSVKPGLTCLWQVNGRSNTTFERWIELDLEYIDSWSLGLDLAILVKTVPAVLRGSGAA